MTEPGKLTGLLTQVGWRHSYHRQQWQDAKQHDSMQEQDGRGESMQDTHTVCNRDDRKHVGICTGKHIMMLFLHEYIKNSTIHIISYITAYMWLSMQIPYVLVTYDMDSLYLVLPDPQ